jgi:hypothetical protein
MSITPSPYKSNLHRNGSDGSLCSGISEGWVYSEYIWKHMYIYIYMYIYICEYIYIYLCICVNKYTHIYQINTLKIVYQGFYMWWWECSGQCDELQW